METKTRKFKKGDYLLHQGELSRYMYIVNSGMVRVIRQEGRHVIYTKDLGAGSVVGELGVIDGMPRVASVLALENVEATIISQAEIDKVNQSLPPWLIALGRSLTFRIRSVIEKLERSPESYAKSSIVSLLIYFSIAESEKDRFGRPELVERLGKILRLPDAKIEAVLEELISGEHLRVSGDKEIVIEDLESLEALSENLKKEIVRDHFEAFKP
jgi:CRP/FNR family transcriptional regulator, cyclic AMP receptor protein